MSEREAILQNPACLCPQYILDELQLVTVCYVGFDGKDHCGQIVVHRRLAPDVVTLFAKLYAAKFPIESVIPISDQRFGWDDEKSMAANNCSGFNYRMIAGTSRLSYHATGHAIDINPVQNPMIRRGVVSPPGSFHAPGLPGTFKVRDVFVVFMRSLGWEWGGDWDEPKDYHHFQKSK
jgi:peptidoglycan L-alanyl-D-glutamate endopeptidase CwlK